MLKLKNIELLIFDLDGTLINSQYDLADAVNYALSKLNRPLISYDQIQDMVGSGVKKLLELALGSFTKEELKEARFFFDDYYSKNYTKKTTYYDGVPEILSYFNTKKKAVYSNKVHHYTVEILERLKLAPYFDMVRGADQNLYAAKPSPEGIIYILEKLNILPENALMIGDSTHDIHAAHAAGISTCAVSYGYRPAAILKKAHPSFIINSLEELKYFILQISPLL